MSINFSFSNLLFKLVTLAVFGGAVHICIVLLLPYVAAGDAWARLQKTTELNRLALLPEAKRTNAELTPNNKPPLAFMAPDVRYAACRYDLSKGPLQLRSPLPNDLWSIALYTRHGENYYLISGRDVQSRAVNLLVVVDRTIDNEKQDARNLSGTGSNVLREITVSAPSNKGIILIRAPVINPAYEGEVASLLKQAFCRPVDFSRQSAAGR